MDVCFILFLFCLYICVCVWLQIQGPLRECPRARRFQATLLLRTTCMRFWCNWSAICVATQQTKDQKPSNWRFVKKTFQKKNISPPPVISRTFKLDEKSKLIKLEVCDRDFLKKNISSPSSPRSFFLKGFCCEVRTINGSRYRDLPRDCVA